jgi:hypothetical protein
VSCRDGLALRAGPFFIRRTLPRRGGLASFVKKKPRKRGIIAPARGTSLRGHLWIAASSYCGGVYERVVLLPGCAYGVTSQP